MPYGTMVASCTLHQFVNWIVVMGGENRPLFNEFLRLKLYETH